MAVVVDANPHVLSADQEKYPLAPESGTLPKWAQGTHLTAEELLQHMDQAGVGQATLIHSSALYGYDNSYTADSAARYPERFVAVGGLDVSDPGACDTLHYWVEERGLRGIRFEPRGAGQSAEWLNAPKTLEVWTMARQLRIPVALPAVRMGHLPVLRTILERFSDVPIILRRMADAPAEDGPPYEGAKPLFELAEYPRLYLGFSQHNIDDAAKGASTPEAFFDAFINRFGARRLMWCSFFPANQGPPEAPYRGMVDRAREGLSFLSHESQDWLLGETTRDVFLTLRGLVG